MIKHQSHSIGNNFKTYPFGGAWANGLCPTLSKYSWPPPLIAGEKYSAHMSLRTDINLQKNEFMRLEFEKPEYNAVWRVKTAVAADAEERTM
jgi:hypothetical protein